MILLNSSCLQLNSVLNLNNQLNLNLLKVNPRRKKKKIKNLILKNEKI